MISMRDAFGQSLLELAKEREDFVVLDGDVAGGTGANVFREAYPERFIQCGIAEQNMVSMAAGLATTGIIPIVTCYAVFASMRAIEQARNSVAYPNFNVKIAASHLGLDVGPDGATHQSIEDIAIFRAIPNFIVVSPADPQELSAALPVLVNHNGPVYLRTGRSPLPDVYEAPPKFAIGKADIMVDGDDVTIFAVGVMVHRALAAAQKCAQDGIKCRVVNMSSLKPLDEEVVIASARKTGAVVCAEDHNMFGGLGGAVAECMARLQPTPMEQVAVNDVFAESGEPDDLAVKYQLTVADIVLAVRKVIARKG